MSQITRVSVQEMICTAKRIEEAIQRWQQSVHEIYMLQSELDYMWDGNANSTFNRQWEEDKAKYNRLTAMMKEYKSAIEAAANLYQQKESEVVQIMNSGNVSGDMNVRVDCLPYIKFEPDMVVGPGVLNPDLFLISLEDDIDSISGAIED